MAAKKQSKESQNLVKQLKPAKYNPRKISSDQLKMLKKALMEYGDLSGIIFNKRTGSLVGGHQRIKVIPSDAEICKTVLDKPSRTGTIAEGYIIIDGEKYQYREVDWDEAREKAANIAANAHGGEWEDEKLDDLLNELGNMEDFDLELTGFSLADIYHQNGGEALAGDGALTGKIADMLRKQQAKFKESSDEFYKKKKSKKGHDEVDGYLVVVFKNYEHRKQFTDGLGLEDNRYVDGRKLFDLLKNEVGNINIE